MRMWASPGDVPGQPWLAQGFRGDAALAVPAAGLAQYYGIGPGQIPMDLRLDVPVVDPDGFVSRVPNAGGAGTAFDATASGSSRPTAGAGHVTFSAAAHMLMLTNPADLAGVHFLAPVFVRALSGTNFPRILSMPGTATAVLLNFSNPNRFNIETDGGHPLGSPNVPTSLAMGQWYLFEVRYTSGRLVVCKNGVTIYDAAATVAPLTLQQIAGNVNGRWLDGSLGRAISVVATGTNLEPAVLLARQTLAAQYGITLA